MPSDWKIATRCRSAAASRLTPTMPLQVIMTAANTVSRASVELLAPPSAIKVTISATSMIVTATASTSEPKGSPTRWATTSAWCTAASTEAARTTATTATTAPGSSRPQVNASSTIAISGTTTVHCVLSARTLVIIHRWCRWRGGGATSAVAADGLRAPGA